MNTKTIYFKVKDTHFTHLTRRKVINSFFSEIEDMTFIKSHAVSMRKEGEEIIKYIDREGRTLKL